MVTISGTMKPQYNPHKTPLKNFVFAYERGLLEGELKSRKELIKQLKKEFEFKDNYKTLNNDRCLLLTETEFKKIINRLKEKK